MITHRLRLALAGATLLAGGVVALPGVASASPSPASFQSAQKKLEYQLSVRVTQLQTLSKDVANATVLTSTQASTLAARLTTETESINSLVVSVPTDTTFAELRSARRTMIEGNRVFAVETPQVFEVIEADAIASEVTVFQSAEPTLEAAVSAMAGEPGYRNARSHYSDLVRMVSEASRLSAHVGAEVITQLPKNFPRDTNLFVQGNRHLLAADVDLAHASYDETIIGLSSGGYTGS
jgi:hypothetical protein